MTKTITFANFKGGVGKTTASVLFSYLLQKSGKKVLLVDFDPQYNATEILFKTFGVKGKLKTSLFEAIEEQDLSKAVVNITPTLDILPSEIDLAGFPMHLYSLTQDKTKRFYFLDFLLRQIKKNYNYVIIDVPPTISEFTNNAIVASDYIVVIMQTHQQSLKAAAQSYQNMKVLKEYNPAVKLLGVVPYLVDKRGKVDNEVIEEAEELFQHYLFKNCIMKRERIKMFSKNGITDEDMHDIDVLNMYQKVVNEFLERIEAE
ncbi:ParA family protein [Pseudobacillus sp. 179-B 2D1 NHS]|uniref:ParA family protein n=1 Tax=Pseudobacillus sp. 179-B 2D1 NHS TaxID=3374292 RepID=UPI003879DCD9